MGFLGIRKNPFRPDEDALDFMIAIVEKEAANEGFPLSEVQKLLLRDEKPKISEDFSARINRVVEHIVEREKKSDAHEQPRSFVGAIEWAGDQEYPYLVQIAEHVVAGQFPAEPLTLWQKVKDLFRLLIVVILLIGIVLGLIALFKYLKTFWKGT